MPRPHKWRMVAHFPSCDSFQPEGPHPVDREPIRLFWEELEAIRLKDLEGLDQLQAAERMEVSRPTFQRILRSARNKVAQALVNGLALRVDGGHFRLAARPVRCRQCGHRWKVEGQNDRHDQGDGFHLTCPECGSDNVAVRHHRSERHSR